MACRMQDAEGSDMCLHLRFTMSSTQDDFGASTNFDDAVSISTRLKDNMDAEGRASNEAFVDILAMLSPLQQVLNSSICLDGDCSFCQPSVAITLISNPNTMLQETSVLLLLGRMEVRPVQLTLRHEHSVGLISAWSGTFDLRPSSGTCARSQSCCRREWEVSQTHSFPSATINCFASAAQARLAVASTPFIWDPCALAELLQAQQLRTDSDDLRPGSSLMEQV